MSQARPTTIRADGTPLPPVVWAPHPITAPPARPRFLRGNQGAMGSEPLARPLQHPVKGAERAQPLPLPGAVRWVGGSDRAPVARGSGSAKAPAYQSTARNVGQYSPTPPNDDETTQRSRRFDRLRTARSILRGTPMGACMRYARDSQAGVQVVMYGGTAGYRGWQHCGSRLCPWCCAALAQKDTDKAGRYIRGWVKRKNAIALCHYTLRHGAEELPQAVWDAQTRVLDSCHHGRPWERFREEYGLLEHIYGNEVTDGANGCHKHQHRAWEVGMCEALKGRAGRRLFARRMQAAYEALYLAALAKHGRSGLPGIALKVSIAAPTMANAAKAAEYVAKFSKETQQGGLKSGSRGNRTVFELLDLAADKEAPDAARALARSRYADLYFGLKGKHWSYFSEASAAADDLPGGEEEVPEVALDADGEVVLGITALQAAMLADQDRQCYLLELVEQQGAAAARCWLDHFSDPARWSRAFLARFPGG